MLSRIAESLFWIGRYVERADDTARILDVHTQRLVEDPWIDERRACANLLALMGSPTPEDEADTERVLGTLAFDRTSPSSIVRGAVGGAENARGAREVLSAEIWSRSTSPTTRCRSSARWPAGTGRTRCSGSCASARRWCSAWPTRP